MKNLKVSMKLIVSFLIVVLMAGIVGFVGIYGMSQISSADEDLYEYNLLAIKAMGDMNNATSDLRMQYRNYIIYDAEEAGFKNAEAAIERILKNFEGYLKAYEVTIQEKVDSTRFEKIKTMFYDELVNKAIAEVHSAGAVNDNVTAKQALEASLLSIEELDQLISESMEYNMELSENAIAGNKTLYRNMTILSLVVLAAAIAVALFFAFYISGLINKPLVTLTEFMVNAGTTGDIIMREEDHKSVEKYAQLQDETGQCIKSTAKFIEHLTAIAKNLEMVANGDLTVDVELLSDKDTMGVSLKKMADGLNSMFGEINASTGQVSTGSKQVADGAQALAQGSTEQAAAVQQLSSSISEIAQKTKTNAEMADKAAKLAGTIKSSAEKGSQQMDEMMSAVKEINQASQSISNVIELIDNIAFQTNILALNAAVEAARAGQHGKGFAVVADEVRNLAAKSADAAKNTGGLISNSIEKAELGAQIANETAASLAEIVAGINESSHLVSEIAKSSDEQSEGIAQINKGIDQVALVVQQNSATAEESAAASQEMSGQANMLEELISQFKLKDSATSGYKGLPSRSGASESKTNVSASTYSSSSYSSGDYGKY